MFCSKCGNEVSDEAVVCPKCGCEIVKKQAASKEIDEPKTGLGILFGLLLGVIGLIIGLCMFKENTIARKSFVKAWSITFGVCVLAVVIIYAVYIARMNAILNEFNDAMEYYSYQ